jgi:hypothetical protein
MEVLDYQFSTSLRVSTLPIAQVDSISVVLIWVNGRRTSALPKHDLTLPFFRCSNHGQQPPDNLLLFKPLKF